MLTWQESKDAIEEAYQVMPEDFCLMLANYMPQNIVDELVANWIACMMENIGADRVSVESLTMLASSYMSGIQTGWYMAVKALPDES